MDHICFCNGWGGKIRTYACESQSLVPYRLATPLNIPAPNGWGGRIRTYAMLESESNALPLGDTPLKYNKLHWLGWQDSDLRVRKSKSRALPLGDTPLKRNGVSKESRTLDLQGHNLAL